MLSHCITNSISVNKNLVWHASIIVFSVSLEGVLKVFSQNVIANDLLSLLFLRTSLSVIFTHVRIIGGHKPYDWLSSLMTDINSYKHSLWRDFLSKGHTPQVPSKFSIDLSHNINEDATITLLNGSRLNKLWNHWAVWVNFIF